MKPCMNFSFILVKLSNSNMTRVRIFLFWAHCAACPWLSMKCVRAEPIRFGQDLTYEVEVLMRFFFIYQAILANYVPDSLFWLYSAMTLRLQIAFCDKKAYPYTSDASGAQTTYYYTQGVISWKIKSHSQYILSLCSQFTSCRVLQSSFIAQQKKNAIFFHF
jgi:hypothetical protein